MVSCRRCKGEFKLEDDPMVHEGFQRGIHWFSICDACKAIEVKKICEKADQMKICCICGARFQGYRRKYAISCDILGRYRDVGLTEQDETELTKEVSEGLDFLEHDRQTGLNYFAKSGYCKTCASEYAEPGLKEGQRILTIIHWPRFVKEPGQRARQMLSRMESLAKYFPVEKDLEDLYELIGERYRDTGTTTPISKAIKKLTTELELASSVAERALRFSEEKQWGELSTKTVAAICLSVAQDSVSVSKIAEVAGITRTSVYKYKKRILEH